MPTRSLRRRWSPARWRSPARPVVVADRLASAGGASCSTAPCTSCAARCRRCCSSRAGDGQRTARDQLDQALEALDGIEREVNGGRRPVRPRLVDGRALAAEAVGRWRGPAARGGTLDRARLARGGRRGFVCDEAAISRALDNLIANALEHGSGPIRRRRHPARDQPAADGRRRRRRGRGAPAPAATDPRSCTVTRPAPGAATGCGSSPRSPPSTAGGSPPARHERGASAVLELPLASRLP